MDPEAGQDGRSQDGSVEGELIWRTSSSGAALDQILGGVGIARYPLRHNDRACRAACPVLAGPGSHHRPPESRGLDQALGHDRAALLQRGRTRAARDPADHRRDGRQRPDLRVALHRRCLHRQHARGAEAGAAGLPEHPDPALPPQRRLRHRAPHRHPAGQGRDRRVDRRRHDLRERAHPRARADPARRPDLRPGRRRPHHRGGHPQVGPGAREVADPQGRRAADQPEDPRPQLRPARLPAQRGAALSAAAAGRLLVRHHDHHRVLVQPARHPLCADGLCQARGHQQVPLRPGRLQATSCRCCGW